MSNQPYRLVLCFMFTWILWIQVTFAQVVPSELSTDVQRNAAVAMALEEFHPDHQQKVSIVELEQSIISSKMSAEVSEIQTPTESQWVQPEPISAVLPEGVSHVGSNTQNVFVNGNPEEVMAVLKKGNYINNIIFLNSN